MRVASVYVLQSERGPVKVGSSAAVARRAKECCRHGFGQATLYASRRVPFYAELVEERAHQKLAPRRVRGEWFAVSADEAQHAVNEAFREVVRSPFPRQEECGCVAMHPNTCAAHTGYDKPCDCECHYQRRRGEWAPRIAEIEEDDDG